MTRTTDGTRRTESDSTARRLTRSLFSTIPIVVAGSMAMSMNLTGPVVPADAEQPERDAASPRHSSVRQASPTQLGKTIREALAAAHAASTAEATGAEVSVGRIATASAPSSYTVAAGDTVSSIAGRFGIATASVLALNGLGWKSVIFPGQVLTLSGPTAAPIQTAPAPTVAPNRYTIVAGDTVSRIAAKTGVPMQAILSANGLASTSTIFAGRSLTIPGTSTAAAASTPIAAAPLAAPTAAPTSIAATAHVIASGDTVAGIAKQYGVSIQAILNANGLGWSSIIYGGRTLVIPGVAVTTATTTGITPLTPAMTANARTVISVGRSLGVSDYGLVIALSAAMQESSLLNLDYGDRDSLGLFQQRPSTGWGTATQVTDPTYASRLFFGGPAGPNRGITAGLLDIPGWQSKTVTQAAQAVQRSGHPDAYAKWEVSAWAWLDQLT